MSHAIKDVFEEPVQGIEQSKLEEIAKMLSLQQFNGKEWFTYGLKSGNVNSLVSGTLCNGKEILIAYVIMDSNSLESGKTAYHNLLNSFECS